MLTDLSHYLNSPAFISDATWACIYALVPFSLITALFMLKIGPRLLLDWGYAWVMAALGLWVARIIYVVKIEPQPVATSRWSLLFALNVLVAMLFTLVVLARVGYQLFKAREREYAHG